MIEITRDFQGWPVYMITLKDILQQLHFKEDDEKFYIEKSNQLLNAYPRTLEDDGMAYGINEEYITEVDSEMYETKIGDENITVFNVFREKIKKPDNR